MSFPARFPGTCARTGTRINPGDPIVSVGRNRYAHASDTRSTPATREDRYVSHIWRLSSGKELYQNKAGRCEDAPCCGCCNV
jgi:hypothetical protein